MKKRVLLLALTLIVCISSCCFAADNGSILNAEEKISYKVIEALVGQRPYADIQNDLAPNMVKEFDNKRFEEVKAEVQTKFGVLSKPRLAVLDKRTLTADRLFYLVHGTKERAVEVMIGYSKEAKKPLIMELTMRGLPLGEQKQEATKK